MSPADRRTERESLFRRFMNLKSDMTNCLASIAAVVQNDPADEGKNYTAEDIAQWVKDAEHYAQLHEDRTQALFTDTYEFLSAAAASAPPSPKRCRTCIHCDFARLPGDPSVCSHEESTLYKVAVDADTTSCKHHTGF